MLDDCKHISPEQADECIGCLLSKNSTETGIFISLLAHEYIKKNNLSKEQFMTSLSNSIDKLEKGEK